LAIGATLAFLGLIGWGALNMGAVPGQAMGGQTMGQVRSAPCDGLGVDPWITHLAHRVIPHHALGIRR
jgi:hypothetical protein